MGMTNVQQNVVSEIQKIAAELISIQGRLTTLSIMYVNENIGALSAADLNVYAPFAHVVPPELADAAGALVAINATLGTNSTSNWAKLLKIVDVVPH